MPNSATLCYWDSCVFLALINEEQDRLPYIRACLDEAQAEDRRIITSTFTITEVAFAAQERSDRALDSVTLERIDKLWKPISSPVRLADYHIGIGETARDLMRSGVEQGWRLRPRDAIHLATAVYEKAQELNTYNISDFKRWEAILGMTVQEPNPFNPQLPGM